MKEEKISTRPINGIILDKDVFLGFLFSSRFARIAPVKSSQALDGKR